MKATKNTVLKYSQYTAALTRSLKGSTRLHCRVNEETDAVHVCNGYFLVKLCRSEYDVLVRPITQREAGNFVIDTDGEVSANMEPLDMEKLLADAAREAVHELTQAPFLGNPCSKTSKATISLYYSESGDFVAGFNSNYDAIISAGLPRKGSNPVSPMVVYNGDEPQAMILPVRLESKENPNRISAAVRAFFIGKPEEPSTEKLVEARKDRDNWEHTARRFETERDNLAREVAELRKALAAKIAEADAMSEQQHTQPALMKETQPEQTPANKAAALVEKLNTLDGITATVKGAQTTAPVVWLAGETDAHKEGIKAMGGKWSSKRGAWYFKI